MSRRKDWSVAEIAMLKKLYIKHSNQELAEKINKKYKKEYTANAIKKAYQRYEVEPKKDLLFNPPKILCLDIETTPLEVLIWQLGNNYVTVDQVIEEKDWSILSYSAKWYGESNIIYEDTSMKANKRNDKHLCKSLKKLLDEADIVIGHNSKRFDIPKINARLFEHGIERPTSFRQIDTCSISFKHFKFTSNKLAYLTAKFTQHEKLKHSKFPGLSLWKECLKSNKLAFSEMEKYNKMDVIVLEEIYDLLIKWDNGINFTLYGKDNACSCGNKEFKQSGLHYTNSNVYQKHKCTKCGKEYRDTSSIKTAGLRPLS